MDSPQGRVLNELGFRARAIAARAVLSCTFVGIMIAASLAYSQALDTPPPMSLQMARSALRNKAPNAAPNAPAGSDAWKAAAAAPSSIARYAFAQVGPDFYIFGGGNESGHVAEAWRYSATSDTWTPLADLPVANEAGAAAALNGKIYLADGLNDAGSS